MALPPPTLDLDIPVAVRLAERPMRIAELRRLGVGSVIELPAGTGRTVDLTVRDRRVAVGVPVRVDGNLGIRVTEAGDLRERLGLLGRPD